jgi:hypothetical protein
MPVLTDEEGIQVLEGMGFSREKIRATEDGFIVEDDMYFLKKDLTPQPGLPKTTQRANSAVNNSQSLRLAIHSSISSYNTVIQQAVNNWNSLKARVHIEIVPSGSAEITVYSDASTSCPSGLRNLGSSTHAIAYVGANGNPGSAICVNMDNAQMVATERNRVSVLTHEIGHSLAFWHTNSTDGAQVPGTPNTDNSSIMFSDGTVAQGIFTHNDIIATEVLYNSDKPLGGTNLDGDNKDDIVVWRPSNGTWYALRSNNNFASSYSWQWGQRADMPMADMDMDGDGIDDKVIWRPADGYWHAVLSSNGSVRSIQWGLRGDIPLSNHDMDGDGKDDLVVWRWTNGRFYVLTSTSNYASGFWYGWGTTGDTPVSGIDADKDGKDDWVVWRPTDGRYYVEFSSTNFTTSAWYGWGQSGDIPMGSTDLDRDTKDDLTVWRPSDGNWFARTSSSSFGSSLTQQWGVRGDVPVIGTDIDQDGKKDIVVWRPSNATWYIKKSGSNFTTSASYVWGQ